MNASSYQRHHQDAFPFMVSRFITQHPIFLAEQSLSTHSSTLLTIEEIFGLTFFLGDAAHATGLGDLFLPVRPGTSSSSPLQFPPQPTPIATRRPTHHSHGSSP